MRKRITKVTTKTGDDGTTSMADGSRTVKSSRLIKAIGEVDELNSWIGLLSSLTELSDQDLVLKNIQNCLFDIGGSLTMKSKITFNPKHTRILEKSIAKLNKELPDLDNFILPGGHESSSKVHITRTVCRRAERSIVKACKSEMVDTNCIAYVNRLSDFLFILARKINIDLGIKEITWSQEDLT